MLHVGCAQQDCSQSLADASPAAFLVSPEQSKLVGDAPAPPHHPNVMVSGFDSNI
jgi:hypothetical protein